MEPTISIVKVDNKYYIYSCRIKCDDIRDKLCRWWGEFNTMGEAIEVYKDKIDEYDSLTPDIRILRKIKLQQITNGLQMEK